MKRHLNIAIIYICLLNSFQTFMHHIIWFKPQNLLLRKWRPSETFQYLLSNTGRNCCNHEFAMAYKPCYKSNRRLFFYSSFCNKRQCCVSQLCECAVLELQWSGWTDEVQCTGRILRKVRTCVCVCLCQKQLMKTISENHVTFPNHKTLILSHVSAVIPEPSTRPRTTLISATTATTRLMIILWMWRHMMDKRDLNLPLLDSHTAKTIMMRKRITINVSYLSIT